MGAPSLSDLLTVPSQDDVLNQEVLPELTKRKVRITDWFVGGVYRAMAYLVALLRVNVRLAIATFVAAGFEDYAFGFATPPANPDGSVIDVTGWAPFIAKQRYGIDQLEATPTRRTITLSNLSLSAYGPLQPGPSLMVQFPSGNRYILDQVVTIAASTDGVTPTVTTAMFRSEFNSDSVDGLVYNDPPGSALSLVTSNYPGVTASNPATTYTPVGLAGIGIGLVVPTGSPALDDPHSVAVRIDGTGNASDLSVQWSTNVDNGGWVSQSGVNLVTNLGGYGINIALHDNGGSPAFIEGDVYYLANPGSDIVQVGADVETPQALGTRCRGIIPALSFQKDASGNWTPISPVDAAYRTLALSANDQVRIVFLETDPYVNNRVNIIIAGQGGAPLSPGVIANVQSFFDAFNMTTDDPVVQTSTGRPLSLGGLTISTPFGQTAATQRAMTLRLQKYLGGVDSSTVLSINGTIDYDYLVALIRTTPGVTKVSGTLTLTTTGGTVTTDLPLPIIAGAFESVQWSQSATSAFTWTTSR